MSPPWRLPLVLACVVACHAARAEPRRPQSARTAAITARADAAFNAGRYAEAAGLYQQLLDVDTSARTLFRTAESHRLAGNQSAAVFYLESYATVFPKGEHAEVVRERLEQLRPQPTPAQTTSSATTTPTPGDAAVQGTPAPGVRRARRLRDAAIGVGVTALALGVAGAGLLGSVPGAYDDLRRECTTRACGPDDWAGAQSRAYAGYGLLAVAGVALVVDVSLWAVWVRSRKAAR